MIWRLSLTQTLKCCYGISSRCENYEHIIMLDYDRTTKDEVIEHIKRLQKEYGLSDFYLINTTNGFNAVCLDKLVFGLIYSLGMDVTSPADREFFRIANIRNYFTLRFDIDKRLDMILKSSSKKYDKSFAHKKFLEWFFDVQINQDKTFDENTNLVLVQYPSIKNGYHMQRIEDYVTDLKFQKKRGLHRGIP